MTCSISVVVSTSRRRVLESLIRAGALDRIGANRATLMIQLPLALKMAEQHAELQATGQDDMFGMAAPEPVAVPDVKIGQPDLGKFDRLLGGAR